MREKLMELQAHYLDLVSQIADAIDYARDCLNEGRPMEGMQVLTMLSLTVREGISTLATAILSEEE